MFYERKMFWVLSGVALTTLVTLWAAGQNGKAAGLDNTACPVPVIMEHQQLSPYDVLSPVGRADITMIKQAPRLDTLNGKTIAVVGGSFMASVTHPEIRQLILENYPQAKVLLLGEIGSAGPYPAPGVKRAQKDEFERRLQELHVDAVISGNGGCGLCTPKEEGSCLTAEYLGIPSVMIAAPGFVEQARYVALTAGVPVQRVAVYPGAFSAHTTEELIRNTREILWPQIVEGLTKPIDSAEQKAAAVVEEYTADKVVFSGNLAEVQEFFEGQGWTDGQPIIPPTQAVVEEFFKYTPYGRDDVIGKIPPAYRQVTARHVAVVGAMAGCPPEYMPLLIAFTKAMQNGDFRRTLSSTHAWTPFMWLNGPVARQLGIDAGQGEISVPANKKLGRFIDLAMLNLGGYDVKKNRMGTFGYLSSWAMAEDEEALSRIGWSPYHMLHGFAANDSTVNVLIRICVFHYLFEYIHPFYDGNGRTGRFILSYCISENLENLLAFRISAVIRENLSAYYRAFTVCNEPRNLGDLTPFLIMMLKMIRTASLDLKNTLDENLRRWKNYLSLYDALNLPDHDSCKELYDYLVQASLFSEMGVSTGELLALLNITHNTLKKRLASFEAAGLLKTGRNGNKKYYSLDLSLLDRYF